MKKNLEDMHQFDELLTKFEDKMATMEQFEGKAVNYSRKVTFKSLKNLTNRSNASVNLDEKVVEDITALKHKMNELQEIINRISM